MDLMTSSNTDDFLVEHSYLDWSINFSEKSLTGFVEHSVKTVNHCCRKMILDVKGIEIIGVFVNGTCTKYKYERKNDQESLRVSIKKKVPKFKLKIIYKTTESCEAIQWFDPSIHGERSEFLMYSQCQPIYARSIVPCQDCPAVRATFSATVRGPLQYEVLMSAIKELEESRSNYTVHTFKQNIPVPSYLIAIACGRFVRKNVSLRSVIWAEPHVINDAVQEFADVDQLLNYAESICGPYEWEIYNMVVLPRSFPFGAMENPYLTFISELVISGDGAFLNTVAHEIAHSWTGNLVTNYSWEHLWLNEGHANYIMSLIMEKYLDSTPCRHLNYWRSCLEVEDYVRHTETVEGGNSEICKLVPKIGNREITEFFNCMAYEKGSFFLFYLESLVGIDRMLRWLKSYITTHRLKSITSCQWKEFFIYYMRDVEKLDIALMSQINWEEWFYGAGAIPINPKQILNLSLAYECEKLGKLWEFLNCTNVWNLDSSLMTFHTMTYGEKMYFFKYLIDIKRIKPSKDMVNFIEKVYNMSKTKNYGMKFQLVILRTLAGFHDFYSHWFSYMNYDVSMENSKVLYRILFKEKNIQNRVLSNYEENKHNMHPITKRQVETVLELNQIKERNLLLMCCGF